MVTPPNIFQTFSHALLSTPCPSFTEDLSTFDIMLKELKKKWNKLDKDPVRKLKCEKLLIEIENLYERAKAKEKERKEQKDHATQQFGYSVPRPKRMVDDVYWRLNFGSKDGAPRPRKYHYF